MNHAKPLRMGAVSFLLVGVERAAHGEGGVRGEKCGQRVWVFHKIRKEYLRSMRRMGENEKVVDIRVQDPADTVKVYATFRPGDILHFVDTGGEALRVILGKISSYPTVREALDDVGYKNAFPEAASLDDAEDRCLSLGNYRRILAGHPSGGQDGKPVFALWFMRYMFYVAGPYTPRSSKPGTPEAEVELKHNIERAIHAGKDILTMGYIPIVPHSLFNGWEHLPGLDEGLVVMTEKAAVARCEAFFKIASSFGTDSEERLARALGKDIFTAIEQVSRWDPSPQADKDGMEGKR